MFITTEIDDHDLNKWECIYFIYKRIDYFFLIFEIKKNIEH
jgi:hypothetical protein